MQSCMPKNETIIITLGNYFGLYLRLISSAIIIMVGFVMEGNNFGFKKKQFSRIMVESSIIHT